MRHAFSTAGKLLLIAAMVTAFGGHWMVLQSVAWTTMIIANAQNEDLGHALHNTFDGQHPCDLCKCIKKARDAEKKPDTQADISKINLFHETNAVTLSFPSIFRLLQASDILARNRPLQPILQPPREAHA